MTRPLLQVRGVSKSFSQTTSVSERFSSLARILISGKPKLTLPVISDISFDVSPGQSLAIVGGNGAGKSTLLKLITGVMEPSSGSITKTGSVATLLELGAGFDPEQTGLENLRMNAGFLGLSVTQVETHLEEIIAFADIGEAIHEPVKHYSSGMVVRLGFAVVAAVKPDLLITDEVLAVGDESFQKKCIRWIEHYLDQGGTLLMVSHNMYQVQKLCQEAIWLDRGVVRQKGDVFAVTQQYLAWHEQKDAKAIAREHRQASLGHYGIEAMHLNDAADGETEVISGGTLSVSLRIKNSESRSPVVLVGIVRADGSPVYGVATDHDGFEVPTAVNGYVSIACHFTNLPLLPGVYKVRAHTLDAEGLRVIDSCERALIVSGQTRELGSVRIPHHWGNP
jgi:lipopolysaccharide transport system ATP-binding protein